ncbi:MAG: Patatin-like phospholipase [Frankiales bacterium]|nr:Patatin-like phospholipase [Frankiales bacterium]
MVGRTLVVLGGGGALGAFQAGALLALAEDGVLPDALYGCSAGGLNAAFLAAGPSLDRAVELVHWWGELSTTGVLLPSRWSRARGLIMAATGRSDGVLDPRPLRALVARHIPAHDVSELAVPLSITTTCLDCADARHHHRGRIADVLVASCALPGLFPPVRLADGHLHVDGGIVCGVPVQAALDDAGPDDRILVLDCGLAPVTGTPGVCAARGGMSLDEPVARGCGLEATEPRPYVAPVESSRGVIDVVLKAFTVARAVANTASVRSALDDPRVSVLPHVADAWAAGLLRELPSGPRDLSRTDQLAAGGRRATEVWLAEGAGVGA